jgi:glutaredoxin 2
MGTLYHYLHCPYCIRVRLAAGFLQIPYTSRSLDYDDEVTPVRLCGKKMLPIWEEKGKSTNESLDIILMLDSKDQLAIKNFYNSNDRKELDTFLSELSGPIHSLAMPIWIYTKEFTPSARDYFQSKKEEKKGPFKDLVKNKDKFLAELAPLLHKLENELIPYYQSSNLTIKDILLAAHLWGMYVVPEFQFSPALHEYLMKIKKQTKFQYMDEVWQ